MSADVAGFLDAVGVGSAVIAGHSMGSIVAQRVALDHPDRAGMAVSESQKPTADVWRERMDGVLRVDFSAELPSIAAPTLVIAGECDDVAPLGDAGEVAALIPGARLVIYDDAGHAVHWEDPAHVAGDMAAFARDGAAVAI